MSGKRCDSYPRVGNYPGIGPILQSGGYLCITIVPGTKSEGFFWAFPHFLLENKNKNRHGSQVIFHALINEKIIITIIVKFKQFFYKRILFYLLNKKESKS